MGNGKWTFSSMSKKHWRQLLLYYCDILVSLVIVNKYARIIYVKTWNEIHHSLESLPLSLILLFRSFSISFHWLLSTVWLFVSTVAAHLFFTSHQFCFALHCVFKIIYSFPIWNIKIGCALVHATLTHSYTQQTERERRTSNKIKIIRNRQLTDRPNRKYFLASN